MNAKWDDPTRAVISNIVEFVSHGIRLKLIEDAELTPLHKSIRYYWASQSPLSNGLFQADFDAFSDQEFPKFLSELDAYFSKKKVPYMWWWLLQDAIPERVLESLQQAKMKDLGEISGIYMELDQLVTTPKTKDIRICEVTTENDYRTFIDIYCKTFEISGGNKNHSYQRLRSYGNNGPCKHYLGYYEDIPACTLTTYQHENALGVYNGATLPSFRKKGLLTSILQQALFAGITNGSRYSTGLLMASAMASGTCEQLGFKKVCRIRPFLKEYIPTHSHAR
jgi:hypothetical protein